MFIFIGLKFWKIHKCTFFTRMKKYFKTKFWKNTNLHFYEGCQQCLTGGGGEANDLFCEHTDYASSGTIMFESLYKHPNQYYLTFNVPVPKPKFCPTMPSELRIEGMEWDR